MKKITALIISLVLILSFAPASFAAGISYEENVWFALTSMGIFEGNGENSMDEDRSITRAEMCAVILRTMGLDEVSKSSTYPNSYSDISGDEWYAGYVAVATQFKLVNGYPDGTFRPNNTVSYEEAIKIVVNMLGYTVAAENAGGYPGGYLSVASRYHILDDVRKTPFVRKDVAYLIYNSLDISLMEQNYTSGGNGNFEIQEGDTYLNRLLEKNDMYMVKGIYSADAWAYTEVPYEDLEDDEIVVDNVVYHTENLRVDDFFGMEVVLFAKESAPGRYDLISMQPTDRNEKTIISAQDLKTISSEEITYKTEKSNKLKIRTDMFTTYLYNGAVSSYDRLDVDSFNSGFVTVINNDTDNIADVVLVEEYESAVVDRAGDATATFKEGFTPYGRRFVTIEEDDDKVRYILRNADGENISLSSVETENVLSIAQSDDKTRVKVVASDVIVQGKITATDEDYIYIDDKAYGVLPEVLSNVNIGDNVKAYVDFTGSVIGVTEQTTEKKYLYVLEAGIYNRKLEIKAVVGNNAVFTEETEISSDEEAVQEETETVKFIFIQNEGVDVFTFADKIKINDEKYSLRDAVDILQDNPVIEVVYDSEGHIKSAETLSYYSGSDLAGNELNYNVYDRTFGGLAMIDGIQLDENTHVICVPYDESSDDEDFLLPTRISELDSSGAKAKYLVCGYEKNHYTKKAGLVVIRKDMDASLVRNATLSSSKVSMVKNIKYSLNEDDETIVKIKLIENGEEKEFETIEIGEDNSILTSLKTGDLITYIKNTEGKIENVLLIRSFKSLNGDLYSYNTQLGCQEMCGTVENIEYTELNNEKNRLVDIITLNYGSVEEISLQKRNRCPVYLYNLNSDENVQVGTIDDVILGSDKIYMLLKGGTTPVACVVVRGAN